MVDEQNWSQKYACYAAVANQLRLVPVWYQRLRALVLDQDVPLVVAVDGFHRSSQSISCAPAGS
jgi:hypothetical protein